MKVCPFCHAEIEDSCRFCVYCMHSLNPKRTVGARPKRPPLFSVKVPLFSAVVFAVVLGFLLAPLLPKMTLGFPRTEEISAKTEGVSTKTEENGAPASSETIGEVLATKEEPSQTEELFPKTEEGTVETLPATEESPPATEESPPAKIEWSVSGTVLTLSGKGKMPDFDHPWKYDPMIESVTEIIVSEGITGISEGAFSGLDSLKAVSLPASLKFAGGRLFDQCRVLETITVAKENPYFCDDGNCLIPKDGGILLEGTLHTVIPNTVTQIAPYAFSGRNLIAVQLPDSVALVGERAFFDCEKLVSFRGGNSLRYIGSCAFKNCFEMKTVEIPRSLEEIASSAFYMCFVPGEVYYQGSEADRQGIRRDFSGGPYDFNEDFFAAVWHYKSAMPR